MYNCIIGFAGGAALFDILLTKVCSRWVTLDVGDDLGIMAKDKHS